MATRSNIYLKLKDESKGQTLKFDINKLPGGNSPQNAHEYPIKDVKIPENANYIGIYHHWDGYPEGVGATLKRDYTDYDKILNLLMMGDMSSINDGVTSYQGWRNEDTPPRFIKSKTLPPRKAVQEEYAYLFKNGEWKKIIEGYCINQRLRPMKKYRKWHKRIREIHWEQLEI